MAGKQPQTNILKFSIMSKYYDGSEKDKNQGKNGTAKNTVKKIIKGAGSVLGLVGFALGGVKASKKFNNKG